MRKILLPAALCAALISSCCNCGETVTTDWSSPVMLAHRGGRAEQEENTLEAFKATYEAGCHAFETDIHFDADKNLVIMHDGYLGRMTTGEGKVEGASTEYIRSITTKQGHKVPFLEDLLAYFSGCSGLYVEFEMKTNEQDYPQELLEEYCDKVHDAVMGSRPADALYVLSSFDIRALRYIREKYPETEVMYITGDPCSHKTVDYCIGNGINRAACWLNRTTREAVRYAHSNGMKINLWPGNKPEDTALAAMLEADYLCTDIPQEVMSYVEDHKLDIRFDSGDYTKYSAQVGRTAPALAAGARKRLVCMDLDGTLTQHKTQMTPQAKEALDRLAQKYDLLMVGGGGVERIHAQMGEYPIAILGNYGMEEAAVVDGQWKITRQDACAVDTAFFMEKCSYLREKYGYTKYYGDPLEFHKSGMVTFGLLGTEAPSEAKLAFDPDKSRRRAMYKEVCEIFKDYSVFIGGTTSFDITLKHYNKYDAVMKYAEENGYSRDEIIFFGDDLDEGGNDSHIRLGGMDYIRVDDYGKFPELARIL